MGAVLIVGSSRCLGRPSRDGKLEAGGRFPLSPSSQPTRDRKSNTRGAINDENALRTATIPTTHSDCYEPVPDPATTTHHTHPHSQHHGAIPLRTHDCRGLTASGIHLQKITTTVLRSPKTKTSNDSTSTSSFSKNSEGVARSLAIPLDEAIHVVPKARPAWSSEIRYSKVRGRSTTPLYPCQLQEKDGIVFISEKDEGIKAWVGGLPFGRPQRRHTACQRN